MKSFRRIPSQIVFYFMLSLLLYKTSLAKLVLQESPSRFSEPAAVVVSDLKNFIPGYMREQKIPGVGIAFIRNGTVVWEEGFGVTNTITRRPVTRETLFEVASNSKVVTAYIALRLVDQGILSLDRPLNTYLPAPWLPPSEYRNVITLRHVLSHSSGLGHNTASRQSLFAPGQGYSYSAIGYQYLQAVLEQVTGKPLEQLAREQVFTPLGMASSSFINRRDFIPRMANGHLHALVPAVLFAASFLIFLIVTGIVSLVILRFRTGHWRPSRRMVISILVAAFILSVVPGFILFGPSGLAEFAWLIVLYGLALAIAFSILFLAGRYIIIRLAPHRPGPQVGLSILWSTAAVAGLFFLSANLTNLPVPKWTGVRAEAAGSLRATAGDLALFLTELSAPKYLSDSTASQLRTSQIKLSEDLSWGLGPGILHTHQGDVLWQWGQHIDFQSIMMISPEHGSGVVVCTNNDLLNPDVALEIAHRALGGPIEPVRRAIHLGFNYREAG